MSRTIGITGNIACGKSAVGKMLLELGVERYIDADALVHRLYEPGQLIAAQVAVAFGSGVMAPDGSVDRRALGAIVFGQAEAMQRLEQIVHPAVAAALLQEVAGVSADGIVVIDAVKLLEGFSGQLCQSKWIIICTPDQELARLMARNQLSEQEARQRLQAQPPVEPRLALVDEVIDNSGSLEETRRQVGATFKRFTQHFPLRQA